MRALVLNLAGAGDRLSFQSGQLARAGLPWDRIEAVTPARLDPPASDPVWQRWQRPLRDVEKAALLTHRLAWQRVADGDEPVLVLEDDAWLMQGAAEILDRAAGLDGIDHLSLETRGRRKILGAPHPALPAIRRLWLDRTGAAAYLLWPQGARKMIARAASVPALADAVPVETPGLRRWQADPALAIQVDMAGHYGLVPPMAVASSISTAPRPVTGGMRFRLRRIGAQLAMGAAQCRRLTGAERCEVFPAPPQEAGR